MTRPVAVRPVTVETPGVRELIDALTAELAQGGYGPQGTFGYSVERLAAGGVHLMAAVRGGELAGLGGLELQPPACAELKRFYVRPADRGSGVADALLGELVTRARAAGVRRLRLETGDRQHAALRFYRRHGFVDVPRFGQYADSPTSVCLERDLDAVEPV